MARTFNNTFVTEIILKFLDTDIHVKCHLTNKLLNHNLIVCGDILHKLGIIFNFENKTITWQDVSILMKPPNCTAKEFLEIKQSCPVRIATRIKQILDAEYKKINLKSIVMNLNYSKDKYINFSFRIASDIRKNI